MPIENQNPNSQSNFNDPYNLMSGDNPGMSLTATSFNGLSFMSWSRTIKMALGAKMKLGFINGTLSKPEETDVDHQRWIRCDFMVICWILNSMTNEVSNAFVYIKSAFDLWREIVERYVHCNGPLLYQLRRELNEINQNDMSVTVYFNKLKRCWDEIEALIEQPVCSCGRIEECNCRIMERYQEIEEQSHLMQFLMRLNGDYEGVRSQVLSMDPLPSVNRAFYVIQQVERQKSITHRVHDSSAFYARGGSSNAGKHNVVTKGMDYKFQEARRGYDSRGGVEGRDGKRYCTHCHQTGLLFDNCFERVGYPDWYKGKKGKRSVRMAANVFGETLETPLDLEETEVPERKDSEVNPQLIAAVCEEVMKVFQSKKGSIPGTSSSFAGPF